MKRKKLKNGENDVFWEKQELMLQNPPPSGGPCVDTPYVQGREKCLLK